MATEKLIAGSVSAYTTIMSTELNSLASGNALLGSTDIDNSSNLDCFMDFSLLLASAAFVAPNFIGLYLYPLHDNATQYGDGRFGSAAAGPPSSTYFVDNFEIAATTAAQYGEIVMVRIPRGIFRPVLWNKGGVNWASSGNLLKYRTTNRQIA